MSHSNVPQPSSSRPRQRRKLNEAGVSFLLNYANTVSPNPTKEEKEMLVVKLRTIPGNEDANIQRVGGWFRRHHNTAATNDCNGSLLDDEGILFPKLSLFHIRQLRVLYRKRPDPAEAIITFWADRIKADKEEVTAWIRYQQTKALEDVARAGTPESLDIPPQRLVEESASASASPTVSESPRPHLPTPAKSPSVSPHTRMPSLPPIAVKLEEPRQSLSPVASPSDPVLVSLPPTLRHLGQVKSPTSTPLCGQESDRMLAACVRESLLGLAAPTEQPPRTADEFAKQFGKIEKMIESFLNKCDSGQLVGLGWDASLSNAVS